MLQDKLHVFLPVFSITRAFRGRFQIFLRRLNLSFLGVVIDVMVTSKNQETKANDKMNRKIRDQNEKFFLFIKWGKNYKYNVFRLNTL